MSEWSKETDSKSVVPSDGTEGSNPSLSDSLDYFLDYAVSLVPWRGVRVVDGARLESVCAERHRGFESPLLRFFPVNRFCAMDIHPTPSGPEGSSGK